MSWLATNLSKVYCDIRGGVSKPTGEETSPRPFPQTNEEQINGQRFAFRQNEYILRTSLYFGRWYIWKIQRKEQKMLDITVDIVGIVVTIISIVVTIISINFRDEE